MEETFHPPYTGKHIPYVAEEVIVEAVKHIRSLLEVQLSQPDRGKKVVVLTIPLSHLDDFSYPTLGHAMLRLSNQGWGISFIAGNKKSRGCFQFTNYKQHVLYAELKAFQTSRQRKSVVNG